MCGRPSSPADEVVFINFLIDMSLNTTIIDAIVQSGEDNDIYRSSNNFGALSDATVDGAHTDNSANNSYGYSGYNYFLAKYGKNSYVWYVSGLSGTYNVGTTSIGNGGGLSHTAGYTSTSVPDGSMTVALLGIGLAGLTVVSRMFHA